MKLQRQTAVRIGKKRYPKWVVIIPPKQIEALGWKKGECLECDIIKSNPDNPELVIRKESTEKT